MGLGASFHSFFDHHSLDEWQLLAASDLDRSSGGPGSTFGLNLGHLTPQLKPFIAKFRVALIYFPSESS